MTDVTLRLDEDWFPDALARAIREARRLIGWSQAELAERAGTSQSTISRLEAGRGNATDLGVHRRVIAALGIRGTLALDALHLHDRRRQRDPVHARLVAYVARRLERAGWLVATEVPIGDRVPRGWIDVLAFRPADQAGIISELKGDLPDLGGLQRQVGFYQRAAGWAARPLGWTFERTAVLVGALDSRAIADRLADNRPLVMRAFPGRLEDLDAWIRSPTAVKPQGPTLAMVDPLARRGTWLHRPVSDRSRRQPAYTDYADAAARLRRRRR